MKKIVIVKIDSGLGNQLFQYAFGRALSLRSGCDLRLDTSFYASEEAVRIHGPYRLDRFNTNYSIATDEEIVALKYRYGLFSKYYQLAKVKMGSVNASFHRRFTRKKGDIYLAGYWQDERYFSDFADVIRNDFTLKQKLGQEAQKVADEMQKSMSVSLHVRRGEMARIGLTHPHWGISTWEYYLSALECISEKIGKNFRVFVFSDSIEVAKKNNIQFPVTYVSRPGIESYEEIMLMSMCKHNIISNSTFSWWGAWLNKNPEKIIIAPSQWTRNKWRAWWGKNIVPARWVRI